MKNRFICTTLGLLGLSFYGQIAWGNPVLRIEPAALPLMVMDSPETAKPVAELAAESLSQSDPLESLESMDSLETNSLKDQLAPFAPPNQVALLLAPASMDGSDTRVEAEPTAALWTWKTNLERPNKRSTTLLPGTTER